MSEKRLRATHLQDPFREHSTRVFRERLHLLGGVFEFQSNSRQLLRLVETAYAGLPRHRLATEMPRFHLALQLNKEQGVFDAEEPPQLQTQGGAGLLCGVVDAANFAVVCPETRSGLVSVSRGLLRFPYHARYELLEFAVFTLASRAQMLAPLHGGCIGLKGSGLLLLGDSGAGKSTLALQCMRQGLDLLAEDAVFVAPGTLLATGIANFLHLRGDSLSFIDDGSIATEVRKSPVIRRRSGVEKFEIDLRRSGYRTARKPLQIAGVVFLSTKRAGAEATLKPLDEQELLARLAASQPYAAGLPSWSAFAKKMRHVCGFELSRGRHPREAASALRALLETAGSLAKGSLMSPRPRRGA
jgi:hypothetical protein